MRLRDTIALTLPSFFLRLVLGLTFIWAGTGKLIGTMQVSGDDAARLANLGVALSPITPQTPGPDQGVPDEPVAPLPDSPAADQSSQQPAPPPQKQPTDSGEDANKDPNEDLQRKGDEIIERIEQEVPEQPDTPEEASEPLPGTTEPPAPPSTEPAAGDDPASGVQAMRNRVPPIVTPVMQLQGDRTARDFPEPVECQRLYSIALMISKASDPGLTSDSQPIPPIMPPKLASKPWPTVLAWMAAITELVAGGLLLIGFLTRICALSTLVVMLVAIWMTQIGPAAMHAPDAILGFIPRHDDLFSPAAYATLLWQLALAAMSLAVVFLGSGAIGLDRVFFPATPRDPYLHGDPKAVKKNPMNPAVAQRSEFDRSPPKD